MRIFVQSQGNQAFVRRGSWLYRKKMTRRVTPRLGIKAVFGWKLVKVDTYMADINAMDMSVRYSIVIFLTAKLKAELILKVFG